MPLINRKSFIQDEEEDLNLKKYKLPTLVLTKPEVISPPKALAISIALHPAVVLLIWLIVTALALMGIQLFMFPKPDMQ